MKMKMLTCCCCCWFVVSLLTPFTSVSKTTKKTSVPTQYVFLTREGSITASPSPNKHESNDVTNHPPPQSSMSFSASSKAPHINQKQKRNPRDIDQIYRRLSQTTVSIADRVPDFWAESGDILLDRRQGVASRPTTRMTGKSVTIFKYFLRES